MKNIATFSNLCLSLAATGVLLDSSFGHNTLHGFWYIILYAYKISQSSGL